MKVLSLTDNVSAIMAWANDTSYDRIFVEQLKTYASPGDLLLPATDFVAVRHIPEAHRAVSAQRNQEIAVGVEDHREDQRRVSLEAEPPWRTGRVPKAVEGQQAFL